MLIYTNMKIEKFESFSGLGGWVNVKIDKQLKHRIKKYVTALDELMITKSNKDKEKNKKDKSEKATTDTFNRSDIYNLQKKITALSNVNQYIGNDRIDLQTKISVITLLQYLREIKKYFNPSAAGFLLETFLAALVHGEEIPGNQVADISSSTVTDLDVVQFETQGYRGIAKLTYQIKLYKKGNQIKINWTDLCDYYVICLKDGEDIDVHILSSNVKDSNYIGGYSVIDTSTGSFVRDAGKYIRDKEGNRKKVKYVMLNTNTVKFQKSPSSRLNISQVDELISSCAKKAQQSIKTIYDNLSTLHYDIDSIVSGVDSNGHRITVENAKKRADKTIEKIKTNVQNIYK